MPQPTDSPSTQPLPAGPLLLFDGDCGFCSRSVRFVLKRDRRSKTLRFAPLASDVGGAIVERHPELRDIDSAVWFEKGDTPSDDVVLVRSSAAIRVARYMGGVWGALAAAGGLVPRGWRDALYDAVARRRGRLAPACELPTEAERERFVG